MTAASANRRKKQAVFISLSAAYVIIATVLGVVFVQYEAVSLIARVFFFLLLNLNILSLFWLVLFVSRHIYRLLIERRRGIIGTKFKTRVVTMFLGIILIPIALLFFVAIELGTNYIDRFFTPQFRRPIETSIDVAKNIYTLERERTLAMARLAAINSPIPDSYSVIRLDRPPMDASASIRQAFAGKTSTEVLSLEGGDVIRAAIPVSSTTQVTDILIVETLMPKSITLDINIITNAYQDYLQLESLRTPLKLNYLLLLSFCTLLIIFTTVLIAIRIAGLMTEPVRTLAQATEDITAGNLNVQVKTESQDEFGMLFKSFNNMVNEIRHNRESLQHAYSNLDNIVRNIRSGVISLDHAFRVLSINEAACATFSVTPEQVIGKRYESVLENTSSDELNALIKSIIIKEFHSVMREVWVSVSKTKLLLRVSITLLRGASGEVIGFLVVLDDITDLIKAQRAVAWQEVARRMTHEIKNPLTPIQLCTERMLKKWARKDKDFDSVFERSANTIIREVQALKSMVNEFSRFGKMPEINLVPGDIKDILMSMQDLYGEIKGLEFRITMPDTLPPVMHDPAQFKRVLINIFDNALVAMNREGILTLTVTHDTDTSRLLIAIADTGPGISDEDKEKLFQPYFSTRKDGTGLGLAISDRIISEHGGSIRVSDNTPTGSVFTIELPVSPGPRHD